MTTHRWPRVLDTLLFLLAAQVALSATSAYAQDAEPAAPPAPAPEPPAPRKSIDLERVQIDHLLEEVHSADARLVQAGEAGGLAAQLAGSGARTYVRLLAAFSARVATEGGELEEEHPVLLGVDEFEILVGADVFGILTGELRLDAEPEGLELEVAQIDARLGKALLVRGGLFALPVGAVNEYLYPEHTALVPRVGISRVFGAIVPVEWRGAGLQVRGRFTGSGGHALSYAAYLTSRLLVDDELLELSTEGDMPPDPAAPEDEEEPSYAFGGQVGYSFEDQLHLGLSAINGPHRLYANERATVIDLHGQLHLGRLELRSENAALVLEDGTSWGVSASAGYLLRPWLQPALGFEIYDADQSVVGEGTLLLQSLNFRPLGERYARFIVRAATWQRFERAANGNTKDFGGLLQMAAGF